MWLLSCRRRHTRVNVSQVITSSRDDQLVAQRMNVQHLQPLDDHFQSQGNCTCHLARGNLSPFNCSLSRMIAITFRQADKDRAHQEIVCKLQVSQKNNCLRVMFDEALRRNTQMLKEKEQQEAAQMQRKLQDPEKEMEALQEFINTDRLPTCCK